MRHLTYNILGYMLYDKHDITQHNMLQGREKKASICAKNVNVLHLNSAHKDFLLTRHYSLYQWRALSILSKGIHTKGVF